MKKTMCRWCGVEMEIIERDDHHFPSLPPLYLWRCKGCRMESNTYISESQALAWAEQPVPFLPEAKETFYIDEGTKDDYYDAGIENGEAHLIGKIIATLAVREEEQK